MMWRAAYMASITIEYVLRRCDQKACERLHTMLWKMGHEVEKWHTLHLSQTVVQEVSNKFNLLFDFCLWIENILVRLNNYQGHWVQCCDVVVQTSVGILPVKIPSSELPEANSAIFVPRYIRLLQEFSVKQEIKLCLHVTWALFSAPILCKTKLCQPECKLAQAVLFALFKTIPFILCISSHNFF
jgi:hypothetical protein